MEQHRVRVDSSCSAECLRAAEAAAGAFSGHKGQQQRDLEGHSGCYQPVAWLCSVSDTAVGIWLV